jgi:stage V sporulation protein AD
LKTVLEDKTVSRNIIQFNRPIKITSSAAVVGEMESKGPLREYFDLSCPDSKFEMDTWEKAEAEMVRRCVETAIKKAGVGSEGVDTVFAGDLTNQCTASTFGTKEKYIPYIGLYGACSTFALAMGMGALSIEAGLSKTVLCGASSHFCSAERQYRFPLEYGCQRAPTTQTTVTGAGYVILSDCDTNKPMVREFLPGIVVDYGVTDVGNMGAAMAPACADTIIRYFSQSKMKPEDFDLILTGDLGFE